MKKKKMAKMLVNQVRIINKMLDVWLQECETAEDGQPGAKIKGPEASKPLSPDKVLEAQLQHCEYQ